MGLPRAGVGDWLLRAAMVLFTVAASLYRPRIALFAVAVCLLCLLLSLANPTPRYRLLTTVVTTAAGVLLFG